MPKQHQDDDPRSFRLHQWLDEYEGPPVAIEWVPGASETERRRLAAIGGLVRPLLGVNDPGHDAVPTGFEEPDLKQWITAGPQPSENAIVAGKKLLAQDDDGLAALYAQAVSPTSRRRLGTFFTPQTEVDRMLRRWAQNQNAPNSVVDVGAGVGIFTLAASRAWPTADVWAVDVNPITLGLLGLRVHGHVPVQGVSSSEPGVRLVRDDYVTWAQKTWPKLRGSRLVLGNPPYTRLQLLPASDRARLGEAAGDLCGGRASLSALMTAATIQLLGPADGLCLLLPAQWLESDYALRLRAWLWAATDRRIELHLFESDLFKDAQVDAVALLVGPKRTNVQPFEVSHSHEESTRSLNRTDACPPQWRALFAHPKPASVAGGVRASLSDFATVTRGVATGGNSFFVVSDSARSEHSLPRSVLKPMVRRLRDYPADTVTTMVMDAIPARDRRWLLLAPKQLTNRKSVAAYLDHGRSHDLHAGFLCSHRALWHDLTPEAVVPDVIIGPATKSRFRFLENEAGAFIANNLYGLTWRDDAPKQVRSDILAWMRGEDGQAALIDAARTQSGGLKKIEPRAMSHLGLPERFRPPAGLP